MLLSKKKLIVFELANNHMGDLKHAINIIKKYANFKKKFKSFEFGFKLQFRDLKTFIHPEKKKRNDIHYIKRFSETALNKKEFKRLVYEIKKNGFISICTPFDENSVDTIHKLKIEIIKVASCSFNDWPLLEKIANKNKPVIASTAGATEKEIDSVVTFFKNRKKDFALMHCVAEYPTPQKNLNFNRLKYLINKYPKIQVGYSTHEHPDETNNVSLAVAMGATIFEKHVGLENEKYSLNKYTSNLIQTENWLKNITRASSICGSIQNNFNVNKKELISLNQLKRGLFAKNKIKKGSIISPKDFFLAFPPEKNQILANDYSKYSQFIAKKTISKNSKIDKFNTEIVNIRKKIIKIVSNTNDMIKKSNHTFYGKINYEISHHYGLDKFKKFGIVILNIINEEYCKKILVIFPGQTHPEQFHKKKTETFHILSGEIILKLNNKIIKLKKGNLVTIKKNSKHEFKSLKGAVIEEVSTTHFKKDSYYTDLNISKNLNRKTVVNYYWE